MDPYDQSLRPVHHQYMQEPDRRSSRRKYKRKLSVLFTLVLLGCAVILFAVILIACAFVINYGSDFQVTGYGGIEAAVQSGFHYSQYWAGLPFICTGILIICSGTFQRHRQLTITTAIFCVISIGLTLFVVALDGSNWNNWNTLSRQKSYWDSQSGVSCASSNNTCVCTLSNVAVQTLPFECDEMGSLASLYGAVVASAILIALICAFSLLTITKTLSWKRILGQRHLVYYDNDNVYVNNTNPNVFALQQRQPRGLHSRPPSFVDLPYAKRGEYMEEPIPASQLPPRQYSYRSYRSSNRGNPY